MWKNPIIDIMVVVGLASVSAGIGMSEGLYLGHVAFGLALIGYAFVKSVNND